MDADSSAQSKLNILVVTQHFWPESFRINEIVKYLSELGHVVTVLTSAPSYPGGRVYDEYKLSPDSYAKYHGAEIVRVPVVPRGETSLGIVLNFASFVVSGCIVGSWRLKRRPFDAIFTFQVSPITVALPAILQRRFKRAPMAMWVLDLWPETLTIVTRGMVWGRERAIGLLVNWIYRRCDAILVQSRAFTSSVLARRKDARVIYCPAWAEEVFEKQPRTLGPAAELEPFSAKFSVIFAGNIGEAQDFPNILQAAEILKTNQKIHWLIIGDGRAANAVKMEVARRGLSDSVTMLGRFPAVRMPEFFHEAGCLLVSLKPSSVFAMTIPGKVQSYLRCGRPVIAVLEGEGAAVVTEAGGTVVKPGDPEALARAVVAVSELNVSQHVSVGKLARDYAIREFDRRALLSRVENILKSLTTHGLC